MAEVEPWEFIQTNIHNASTYPDTLAGRLNRRFLQGLDRFHESGEAYHLSDERSIEHHGQIENGRLRLGHCTYRRVMLAEGAEFSAEGRKLLSSLTETAISLESACAHSPKLDRKTFEINPSAAFPMTWELVAPVANDLLIESSPMGDGLFSAKFDVSTPLDAEIWFADDAQSVSLNGTRLEAQSQEEGCLCRIPRQIMRETNDLQFACDTTARRPFLSLRGPFLVKSRAEWVSGPNGTVVTAGPFYVEPFSAHFSFDLLTSGFPFCRGPIRLRGNFEAERKIEMGKLRLKDVAADCARFTMDGIDLGWTWGPDWNVDLLKGLNMGPKTIELELIPSTYNFFGPHHHFEGDRSLVSPDQFQGQKNFADRPDAPSFTHVAQWHFKPLRMPSGID